MPNWKPARIRQAPCNLHGTIGEKRPLHIAAHDGTACAVVEALVDARDYLEATPLHHAAEKTRSATVVELLLEAGANLAG